MRRRRRCRPRRTRLAAPGSAPPSAKIPVTPLPPGGVSDEDLQFVATHQPLLSEMGYATWYTAPYKGRNAANGQVFDDNALTAAHRTLPMGSLIVVTNLKTGQSSAMRISDRGPFVADRMIDLTIASAKAVGVYQAGLAQVRLDVYQTPKPISTGGRWCVQIGAFHNESDALELKAATARALSGRECDRVSRREQLLGAHPSAGRRPRHGRLHRAASAAGGRRCVFNEAGLKQGSGIRDQVSVSTAEMARWRKNKG